MPAHLLTNISSFAFLFVGILLMFVILLQRGRGGGLAGAFGAGGGQSAFGTKAGDVFTRITIGIAVIWVALAAATGYAMRYESGGRFQSNAQEITDEEGMVVPKPGAKAPVDANTKTPTAPDKTAAPAGGKAAPVKTDTKSQSKSTPTTPAPATKGATTEPAAKTDAKTK